MDNGYDEQNNQEQKYPTLSNLHQQSQDTYLMIDSNGNTKVVSKSELNNSNHSFKKFKKTNDFGEQYESNSSKKLFTDYNFNLKQQYNKNIDPQRGNIIIKRLSQLYYGNSQVQLFPTINRIVNFKNPNDLPHVIHQLEVMPMQHYKSFFITQNLAKNGRYDVLINKDGRFENQFVDDFIPIYQKTNQPIWQMDLNQPWKLILLKVWAKTLNGYENINKTQYFKFIQAFSNSNWKYWNLTKSLNKKSELETFLKTYTNKLSPEKGRILLRTRTSQAVSQSGLILGRVAYELLEVKETEQKQYLVTIRSFNKHRWAGQMSVIDQKLNSKHHNNSVHPVKLEHDMVMNHKDFGNLFASCFICAKDRFQSYFSNFIEVNVSSTNTRAKFIKFTIHQQGLFDFCIKQSERNKVKAGQKTKLIINQQEGNNQKNRSSEETRDRYLHTKYMLARVRGQNDRENEEEQRQNQQNSTVKKSEKDYNPLTYELYEAQYLKGYNRGDAHFLKVTKGQYILRLKCENSFKESNYFINYGCNSRPTVQEVSLSKSEHQQFLRDCFMTTMHFSTKAHTDQSTKLDDITIEDNIEKYGYCFIGVRIKKKADYNLLFEIRPQELQEGGYTIKGKFRQEKQPFAIEVKPGQYTSILLKTIPNLKSYRLSQNAYQFFKKKI